MGELVEVDAGTVREILEPFDDFARVRNALRLMAQDAGEWAGLPLAIENGPNLYVEKSYPYAVVFNGDEVEKNKDPVEGRVIRNSFYSMHKRCQIVIWEKDGKVDWGFIPKANNLWYQIQTMEASHAWGLEQEATALQLLGQLIGHRKFKQYLLSGMFMEKSPRSGIWYMFRKLRPTLALSPRGAGGTELKILAALCLHPIGLYEESFAGAMCPTDDVVAHLALMRGDEHMFWKRANHHPAHMPNAGIT